MLRPAIIIPAYKSLLSVNEISALQQCLRILGNYSVILICHRGVNLDVYKKIADEHGVIIAIQYFNKRYFKSIYGYNSLLLSKKFYKRFLDYPYLLIYQLDAFVFENKLEVWCNLNYDYIGPPWYVGHTNKIIDKNKVFEGVGNGGFSLRKTISHIQILKYKRTGIWKMIREEKKILPALISFTKVTIYDLLLKKIFIQEDIFLCTLFKMYQYRMPQPMEALSFGFELQPARSYKLNDYQLPFGCHAWWRYDPEFWKPHIERFGYKVDFAGQTGSK